ncbi:MAG: GTP-binding protein [Flavobacteriales bacterium]|nr:GTP-binding protein [Flavobacteriales bacterium]
MKSSFTIGIAGGSGSGKTTFLRSLLAHFAPEQVAVVGQDNYYKPLQQQQTDENGVHNFDLPTSIDRECFFNDMQKLLHGEAIEKREYNFNNPLWEPQRITVCPAPIIVIEGLFIFHFEEIRNQLQYKAFLDAPVEERLQRRLKRDATERGYPEHKVRYQWQHHVLPAEEKYLLPFLDECDLVIDSADHFGEGLKKMIAIITAKLNDED